MGPKLMNCCKPEQGHKRAWTNVETNSGSRGGQSSCKGGKTLKKRRTKKENHEKRASEAFE